MRKWSIFQINLATAKVESNRWYFKKKKRAQIENHQWMIKCMQSSLFCQKHKKKVFSALSSQRFFFSTYNTTNSSFFLICFVVFFASLSYLLSKKVETSALFVNGRWSSSLTTGKTDRFDLQKKYSQKHQIKKQETQWRTVRSLHPAFHFIMS